MELKRTEIPTKLDEDRYEVLSKWYHLAIREIVDLPDYKNSTKWISRVLNPQITPQEAAESLSLLKRLGLIVKKDGHLSPSEDSYHR